MRNNESQEMYLEAILDLERHNDAVRSVDVARILGYSKPSVNRAINLLKENELVIQEPYSSIKLTAIGRRVAQSIKRRHNVLTTFFREVLEVDATIAEQDACRIEHIISDESMKAIENHLADRRKSTD